MTSKPLTYKDAGVDIDAGNDFVERIKPLVKRTMRPEVLTGLGGFGGLFGLGQDNWSDPVLVSGTDGVGTKLMLANQLGIHDTIGIDLVAMCVNDVLVQGAEPLFFLDYFACGKLHAEQAAEVVAGIAEGCQQAGAALIGGETAEMPDMYADGDYDLAGFCVGIVERDQLIDNSTIATGDAIIGVASSGPHSNGYSLIRKVLQVAENPNIDGQPAEQLLIAPTRIYVKPVLELMQHTTLKGIAHITGGGLPETLARVLPPDSDAHIVTSSWDRPSLFDWLQERGSIAEGELLRTFNCGIGMVIVVRPDDAVEATRLLTEAGETVFDIGEIRSGSGQVSIE